MNCGLHRESCTSLTENYQCYRTFDTQSPMFETILGKIPGGSIYPRTSSAGNQPSESRGLA